MAIPSYTGLETALRGLTAAQAAIDTTGQNIANANNPAYSRQTRRPDREPLTDPAGLLQRHRSRRPARHRRRRDHDQPHPRSVPRRPVPGPEQHDERAEHHRRALLSQVQTALAEPSSDGVSEQLTAFWSSWSGLANARRAPAAKQTVVDAGQTLADTFNALESQLQTIQSQAAQPVHHPDRRQRADPDRRQPDRHAQRRDQPGPGGRPEPRTTCSTSAISSSTTSPSTAPCRSATRATASLVVNFGGDTTTPLVNGNDRQLGEQPEPRHLLRRHARRAGHGLTSPTGPIAGYLTTLNPFASTLTTSVNPLHTTPPFFT